MGGFLGLGWMEIAVVLLAAILIWGPHRIVEISRTLGKTLRAFKKAANDLTAQVSRELEDEKKHFTQEKPEKK